MSRHASCWAAEDAADAVEDAADDVEDAID
jgi:hypothetical protein